MIEEAGYGDPDASKKRLFALEQFQLLDIDDEVQRVYNEYIERLHIPEKAIRDVVHIAAASVHGMDHLVTRNCTHIPNGEIIKKLIKINTDLRVSVPVIVTPDELMEE